ncbi:MAG: 2-C-methyl-D-erythritol 4-phosphate cytidylyltransferase [candidate division WOR-3 bacterium]|nr:2-C-methyl-D-erythritol 4-phosphate cytidylyltransferase [candidate division WOR-3 bacterium]MDW7988465.1 2-C-methyl-D-erythritol 4-phosphate cytidylyltransferase [candidate division WOR-3 bacterium]
MNFAIILAAGRGQRFGGLKQFLMVNKKPLIYYSIVKFNRSPFVDKIILVTLQEKINYLKMLASKYQLNKTQAVIAGGKERQDSVYNALKLLPDNGYVAIHDAVRPLVSLSLIKKGFLLVKKHRACIPVLPIYDTVKEVKNHRVIKTLERSQLYYVQTPQFFEIALLKKAYAHAYKQNIYQTDDAGIVEFLGTPVFTFEGEKTNIKITEKNDLIIIKKLCQKELQ